MVVEWFLPCPASALHGVVWVEDFGHEKRRVWGSTVIKRNVHAGDEHFSYESSKQTRRPLYQLWIPQLSFDCYNMINDEGLNIDIMPAQTKTAGADLKTYAQIRKKHHYSMMRNMVFLCASPEFVTFDGMSSTISRNLHMKIAFHDPLSFSSGAMIAFQVVRSFEFDHSIQEQLFIHCHASP